MKIHRRTLFMTLPLLAIAMLALTACSLASEPIPAGPVESGPMPGESLPEQPEQPEQDLPIDLPRAGIGEMIFLANCAACHGVTGAGDGEDAAQLAELGAELPDFSDPALARQTSPQEWYRIITDGRIENFMPFWNESLTASQRWDAAYYLYTLSTSAAALEEAELVYLDTYAANFGPQGEEAGLNDLSVAATYSQQALIDEFLSTENYDLPDELLWDVATFMQTFAYDAVLVSGVASDPPETGGEDAGEDTGEDTPPDEGTGEDDPVEEPETPAFDPEHGLVEGRVVNASGSDLPANLEVSLRGIAVDATNQIFEFWDSTSPVGEDGSYSFEDVPFTQTQAAYVIDVVYDGVLFSNGQIIDPSLPFMTLDVELWDNTTDPASVNTDAIHLIVNEHTDALLVTQVLVYSNISDDRIFVTENPVSGGRRGSVAFSLPPEAYNITFEEGQLGGRFIALSDKIYDTYQVVPGSGSHAIILSYFLPYEGASDVEIPIEYQTTKVTLLMQDGVRVRSDDLDQEEGVEVIDNQTYNKFVGQDFASGSTLAFRVQPPSALKNILPTVLLSLAGVLLLAGVVVWFVQRQGQPDLIETGLTGSQESLIREMAELDNAHEAGRINTFDYEARRADLKAAIYEAMDDED